MSTVLPAANGIRGPRRRRHGDAVRCLLLMLSLWLGLCLTSAAQAQPAGEQQPGDDGNPPAGDSDAKADPDEASPDAGRDADGGTSQPKSAPSDQAAVDARCVSAFEQAQLDRRAGKLLQSRAQLVVCASAKCPPVIVERCVPWLSEVNLAIPSVVVAAKNDSGIDIAAVQVIVDDRLRSQQLDGRPIEINPGLRRFRFQHDGSRSIEKQLLIVEGAKARQIDLRFEALPGSEPGLLDRPISPVAIAGFTIAGAGALIGAITGGVALQRGAQMQERCPNKSCNTTDADLPNYYTQSQTIAHVSTVSLAVAGAGALLGIAGLFIDSGEEEPDKRKGDKGKRATPSARMSLQLGPAYVGLAGVF